MKITTSLLSVFIICQGILSFNTKAIGIELPINVDRTNSPQLSQNETFAEIDYQLCLFKMKFRNIQEAIVDCDRAITLNPKHTNAYLTRGAVKIALRDFQGAIDDFDRAITLNPKYALAYNNRGAAKIALKDFQGAIDDFDRAIILDPKYADTYSNRGEAKYKLGDKYGATKDMNYATKLKPPQQGLLDNSIGVNKVDDNQIQLHD
jgi:tetratricopeptide (TPR) repeat protein